MEAASLRSAPLGAPVALFMGRESVKNVVTRQIDGPDQRLTGRNHECVTLERASYFKEIIRNDKDNVHVMFRGKPVPRHAWT